jgi:hypothetical protein
MMKNARNTYIILLAEPLSKRQLERQNSQKETAGPKIAGLCKQTAHPCSHELVPVVMIETSTNYLHSLKLLPVPEPGSFFFFCTQK